MTERKEEMAAEILRKQEEREWAVFVGKGRGKWPVGEATGLASRLCLSHGSVNLCDPSCEFWHISHFSKPPFTYLTSLFSYSYFGVEIISYRCRFQLSL